MEMSGQPHTQATLLLGKEPLAPMGAGHWVGTRTSLDILQKSNISCSSQELNP